MPSKEKLLIIANKSTYHTPPRGIQANMIINELSKYYSIILITSNNSVPDKKTYFSRSIKVTIVNNINKYLFKILSIIVPAFNIKDSIWFYRTKNKSKRICQSQNIKNIVTFSFPISNADIGCYLKKTIPNINLISYFSDPISLNPYFANNTFNKWHLQKYEKIIFNHSDTIVFPSTTMKKQYTNLYPDIGSRVMVIPHCYKSIIDNPGNNKNQFHIIRYFGILNTTRNPYCLLKFINKHSEYFKQKKIIFEFIGDLSIMLKYKLRSMKYDKNIISFLDKIDYKKVPNKMNESFALLLLDANFSTSPFFPSKLVEYLSYKIPIIGITPVGSETEHILKKSGHLAISEEKIEKIIPFLSERLKSSSFRPLNIDQYNIKNISNLWINLIND